MPSPDYNYFYTHPQMEIVYKEPVWRYYNGIMEEHYAKLNSIFTVNNGDYFIDDQIVGRSVWQNTLDAIHEYLKGNVLLVR